MSKKYTGWIAILVIVSIVIIDQVSKIWVKTSMSLLETIEITSWFKIYFIENNFTSKIYRFMSKKLERNVNFKVITLYLVLLLN